MAILAACIEDKTRCWLPAIDIDTGGMEFILMAWAM